MSILLSFRLISSTATRHDSSQGAPTLCPSYFASCRHLHEVDQDLRALASTHQGIVLGGQWVLVNRLASLVTMAIDIVVVLTTALVTTAVPPSRGLNDK